MNSRMSVSRDPPCCFYFSFFYQFPGVFLVNSHQLHWYFDRQAARPLPVTAIAQMSRLLRCDWSEQGKQVGATEGG